MMRIISIANHKGGCAKTTAAINLSACLPLKQRRVLLMDMDPQGHSGTGLGIDSSELSTLIDEVLCGTNDKPLSIRDVITSTCARIGDDVRQTDKNRKGSIQNLRKNFEDRMFETVIDANVKLREAASFGESIVDYDDKSTGFDNYCNLAEQIVAEESSCGVSSIPRKFRRQKLNVWRKWVTRLLTKTDLTEGEQHGF